MSVVFKEVVENVKKLSADEKEDLRFLLERFLIEERRKEIYKNYRKSLREHRSGKLVFCKDSELLRKEIR